MEALVENTKRIAKRKISLKAKNFSIESYYNLESENESGENLEYNNGRIEKKSKMMTIKQAYIYHNFAEYLVNQKYFEKGYRVYAEKEFRTDANKIRIPDMVILNEQNVKNMIKGLNVIPNLLIEVISETDSFKSFEYKLLEYFAAGVKCVWAIIPDIELVYVYSSSREVMVCTNNQYCSAKPAIDFEMITSDIFKK